MAIAYLGMTTEIPKVYDISHLPPEIVGERERTAGGKMRQDVVAVKRAWSLKTRWLTQAEYVAILNLLDSVTYGSIEYWYDEFGGVYTDPSYNVDAYVTVDSDDVGYAKLPDETNPNARSHRLSLTITER